MANIKFLKFSALLIFMFILIFASSCKKKLPPPDQNHTTYYVSPDGDDSNDGLTEATAWRTISYAASSESPVNAGDTVYIKAGDYGAEDIFIEKNFQPDAPRILFIGYKERPGDLDELPFEYGDDLDPSVMPLINPGDRTKGEGINISDSYNITIKNIQIGNSLVGITVWNSEPIDNGIVLENIYFKNIGWEYSTAITMKEANNNTIRNCLIVNTTGAGMDIWGDNNLIEDCKIYSNESEPVGDGTFTSMDYYLVLKGNYNTVRNCYAERDGDLEDVGHGFEIKESGEYNLFENCTVKNMIAGCFSVRWADVQNNEFRHCTALGGVSDDVSAFMIREGASNNVFNSCVAENCQAGVRYILAGEDEDYCGQNNVFNNCIIRNAEWAIDFNSYYYNSAPADNNILANCVIDGAQYLVNSDRPNSGNKLVNCIITNVSNYSIGDYQTNLEFLYNDFFNNGFATPSGTGNISADPLFVAALSGDYHLQSGSPCIDAGTSQYAPTTDFEGTTRPQGSGYDIGAYEYH